MKSSRTVVVDAVVIAALVLAVISFAVWLQVVADFAIPRRNVYFNADTDRVFANLIDRNSNHVRLNVHPLFGIVCIVFQRIFGMEGDLELELAVWSGLQGGLWALFVYLAIRLWGGNTAIAAGGTLLATSSAAFVYWAPITETHLLAGITVLALTALWRWRPKRIEAILAQSAVMFTLGASILITDVAAWGLTQLKMASLWNGKAKAFVADNLQISGIIILGGLAGLGLLSVAAALQDTVLRNESVPPLLQLWAESKYVSVERGDFITWLDTMGLVYSDDSALWIVNLLGVGAVAWALVANGPQRAFIALWPMFGLALHSVYDRAHGFLFSPNYSAFIAIGLALAVGSRWPRAGAIALLALAAILMPLNVAGYLDVRQMAAAQSDPPSWYAPLRQYHPVPESNIVREADPPIGFDQ